MGRPKSNIEEQEQPNERVVEVTSRPMSADGTELPDEITDHFKSLGFRLMLASRNETNVSMIASRGLHPVNVADLPDELQAEPRKLRHFGLFLDPSGFIYKGDCFLFQQSLDDQAFYEGQSRHLWEQQNRHAASKDQGLELEDMISRGVAASGKGAGKKVAHIEVRDAEPLDAYGPHY